MKDATSIFGNASVAKEQESIFGNASSDGSSAASQNVMPLGSQKASVAKTERVKRTEFL
ncbi:MAG: hypothetical protein IKJ95_02550 [Bacteroidaceae bacterium]|nr:hypothetical protein [Bacteroidaceae bacterium]